MRRRRPMIECRPSATRGKGRRVRRDRRLVITGFQELGEGRLEAIDVAEERGGDLAYAGQAASGPRARGCGASLIGSEPDPRAKGSCRSNPCCGPASNFLAGTRAGSSGTACCWSYCRRRLSARTDRHGCITEESTASALFCGSSTSTSRPASAKGQSLTRSGRSRQPGNRLAHFSFQSEPRPTSRALSFHSISANSSSSAVASGRAMRFFTT